MKHKHYIIRVGGDTTNFEKSKIIYTWGFKNSGDGTQCSNMKKGDVLWFFTNKHYKHNGIQYSDGSKCIAVAEFDRYFVEDDINNKIWEDEFYPYRIIFKNMYELYDKNIKTEYPIPGQTNIRSYNNVKHKEYLNNCNLEKYYAGLKRYCTIYTNNTNKKIKLKKGIKLVIKENNELKEELTEVKNELAEVKEELAKSKKQNENYKRKIKELEEEIKLDEFVRYHPENNILDLLLNEQNNE